jgi:hypothetical protein
VVYEERIFGPTALVQSNERWLWFFEITRGRDTIQNTGRVIQCPDIGVGDYGMISLRYEVADQ